MPRLLVMTLVALVLSCHSRAQRGSRHVVFVVGESEYGSHETMPALAEALIKRGHRATVLQSEGNRLPDLALLDDADVLVLFLRFRQATDARLARLNRWIEAGRPTLALRTTSHAFEAHRDWFPRHFGGHYLAHAPNDLGTRARVSAAARHHPILAGVAAMFDCGDGGTYDAQPLADGARPLLFGRTGRLPAQPIAWTFREHEGARLFYTSLGTRDNLARAPIQRLLYNAVDWALAEGATPGAAAVSVSAPPACEPPAGATVLFDGSGTDAWHHWDPGAVPPAIVRDARADTSSGGPTYAAARWPIEGGALVARPGFGDVVTASSFGSYELHLDFWLPPELPQITGDLRATSGVYLAGRYEIQLGDSHRQPLTSTSCGAVHGVAAPARDAARPAGTWQSLDVHFRHERGSDPVVRAWLNDELVQDTVTIGRPTAYGFLQGGGSVQKLRGLRRVWPVEETPDLSDGRFAFAVRFRSDGDGTLVSKAPPTGNWAAHGKTLFLRGGRLVYDIGWVGALTSRARFDDGAWHTAVLGHHDRTALLFVDDELQGSREDFASADVAGHVLKVGATSPNFGGPFLEGEIAKVAVFASPLGFERAREHSGGHEIAVTPVVAWDSSMSTDLDEQDSDRHVMRAPIRLQADCAAVRFANVWVRPLSEVDHARHIAGWDQDAFARGERLYAGMCAACHGLDGETVINPQARAFSKADLQNGSDPLALFSTLTSGFRTMPPQTWMTPAQRYDVVHYLREAFFKRRNPSQYFEVDAGWLRSLPKPLPPLATPAGVVAAARDDLPARDYGPALLSQIGERVPAGMTVRLPHGISLGYDLHTLGTAGAWRGFLDLGDTQHYRQRGEGIARQDGDPLPGLGVWAWAFDGSFDPPASKPPRGPVPKPNLERRGHYVHGRDVVLNYAIDGRGVLEHPTAVTAGAQTALLHTLHIDAGSQPLRVAVARLPRRAASRVDPVMVIDGDDPQPAAGRVAVTGAVSPNEVGEFAAAAVRGGPPGTTIELDGDGRIVVTVPPTARPATFAIVRSNGRGRSELDGFLHWVGRTAADPAVDVVAMTRGGPALWPEVLRTRGELGDGAGSYTVDTLTLPVQNPFGAWLRTSALDCFDDGSIAVATLGGDVWLVDGIDATLDELRWKRFAAGLFEPLGLKIVDGTVYVTCRDGVVRLHDHNGDREADYYECFYADQDVTASFHAFNFDLQRDSLGNLYFVKAGRYTQFSLPGAVVALSPDGTQQRHLATGFRTPNGMGILPDDSLLVSDNQGNWVPASKVSRIRDGGFYGVFQSARKERPDFDPPLIWMPQDVDSSSGGQLWVDDERFGPLAGHLLHTSFGKGWVHALALQEIGGLTQASCVTLPFQFAAGVQRARVNPADGQVYLVGLSGWQGPPNGADGCLQRLRYTGRAETRLLGATVRHDGIELRFSGPVGAEAARPDCYQIEQWSYRWTQAYGSEQFSVRDPERKGHDLLSVATALLADGGRAVRLVIDDLRPADQVRIRCTVPAAGGRKVRDTVHMTIHALPER